MGTGKRHATGECDRSRRPDDTRLNAVIRFSDVLLTQHFGELNNNQADSERSTSHGATKASSSAPTSVSVVSLHPSDHPSGAARSDRGELLLDPAAVVSSAPVLRPVSPYDERDRASSSNLAEHRWATRDDRRSAVSCEALEDGELVAS